LTGWAVLAAGGLGLFGLSGPGGHPAPQATRTARPAPRPAAGRGAGQPPDVTTVATVLRTSPRYTRPGKREPGTVPSTWWGRPSVLPVIAAQPHWVRVRLAQRPNGTTAWLPAADVRLGATPYGIVIDLATTHLMLYKYGREILSAPAGVGAVSDPTPPGEYFAAFDERPPGPGYGPFVMVTSAHSQQISDWDGSGDAVLGIHGPLGVDAAIGRTGARISHGCIRLHLRAQARLAQVPPGTPIDVVTRQEAE
jgi:lipoprotein-anchoring transpeptidase ErfK/SrfK